MNLRDYQEEAIQQVKREFEKGNNKQVIVLATGMGKTVIFSSLAKETIAKTKKKALVLAHREELLKQAKDKILRTDPTLKVNLEMADQHADPDDTDVVVASVATVGRANSKRIGKFNVEDFALIITDEAHHASASTYKNVYRHFGILKDEPENDWNKDLLHLGVTATPNRMDNEGIDKIFNKVVYDYGIEKGIRSGWLTRIKAFRINTKTDLSQIHKTAGDFNLGELAQAVNNDDRNGRIIKAYETIVPGKQALVFAADVAHTQELTKLFELAGIKAGYVIGATPKEEREQTLKDFYDKKLQVVVNAMVLTEGYDNEGIEAILMARPTQSGILFQQMVGRGTRLADGKDYLTVIDFVDNTYKQNLKTTASLLGIPGNVDFKGHDILDVKSKVDELLELAPNINLEKIDIDKIDYAIEEVDLLAGLQVPKELEVLTEFDWHRYDENTYRLSTGNNSFLVVNQNITNQFDLTEQIYDSTIKKYHVQYLYSFPTLQEAIHMADKYIRVRKTDIIPLVNTMAKWRGGRPSDAQVDYLRRAFHVPQMVIDQLDKGKASRLITKLKGAKQKGLRI